MKHFSTRDKIAFFEVLATAQASQVASMVLNPGQVSGEYENEHPDSEQVLSVIDGEGEALIEDQKVSLKTGDIVVIEKGERHQIKNTGDMLLKTLNFYSPPAY